MFRITRLVFALTSVLLGLCSCQSWFQTSDQALVREPGNRTYSAPLPAGKEALQHWEYALLAQVAYIEVAEKSTIDKTASSDAQRGGTKTLPDAAACPDPVSALTEAGWTYWNDFPDDGLKQRLKVSNLRVEVWEKQTPPIISVTFGGTVFNSGKDWKSNLRWFMPKHDDEYTALVKEFVPAFIAQLERRLPVGHPPVRIYSTGHSLGGGLAQEFAYALPQNQTGPRVDKVFAFDPSPVTGFYSVDVDVRTRAIQGLEIDRIFERGEVLASVRSVTALAYPPSVSNPTVRAIRYNFEGIQNPITAHSISRLACGLYKSTRGKQARD
jgi:hypothetical protein